MLKQIHQSQYVIFIRSDSSYIDSALASSIQHTILTLRPPLRVCISHPLGRSIDPLFLTPFGVLHFHQSDIRKFGLSLIVHLNSYNIMLTVGYR